MNYIKYLLVLAILIPFIISIISCSDDISVDNSEKNSMSAKISGYFNEDFVANTIIQSNLNPITIIGESQSTSRKSESTSLSITFNEMLTEGTYDFSNEENELRAQINKLDDRFYSYSRTGTLVLTTVSDILISGTFSFTAERGTGVDKKILIVEDGKFTYYTDKN